MEKGQKNIPDPNPPMKLIGKNNTLLVTFEVQTINNKKCKLRSITKNQHVNSIWVNGIEKFHWLFKFHYIDFEKKGFIIEIDYHDNVVSTKEF